MRSPTSRSPVTLSDVAREAGVSLATASRSLNGSARRVNDEFRERVLLAAAKLNYTPNLSAQAVAKGASNTVALLVSDIADPYFSSIASGVIRAAGEHGLIVAMAVTGRSAQRELELVRNLRGQRPRIIVLTGSRFAGEASQDALVAELKAYEDTGGIVVMITQRELPFSTVLLDNYGGARELAKTLVAQGYRRFGAIRAVTALVTSTDRFRGFADGLAEHGITIDPAHVIETEFTRDGGYDAAGRLLKAGIDELQLVFAVNDVMAIGAMSAFRDGGRAVPESIAVAGYDDIPTARDVTPPLTTMNLPLGDVGAAAIELAFAETEEPEGNVVTIGATVVLRASTPRV